MKHRVLITGATGFIGSRIYYSLKKAGIPVVGTTTALTSSDPNIKNVDFSDVEALKIFIKEFSPTDVVHLAAITNVMHGDISEIYRVNVLFSENLLEAVTDVCPKGTSVIMTSTAGVYGNSTEPYLHENITPSPNNHYSYSKMVMESICNNFRDDLNIRIVRPFNIIGKGQSINFLIPKLVSRFVNREQNILLGNIESIRDYISVEDCVSVYMYLILNKCSFESPLNICSGIGHSAKDAISILENVAGYHINYSIDNSFVRKNEVWKLVGDSTRLNALDKKIKFINDDFNAILKDMYESYKDK